MIDLCSCIHLVRCVYLPVGTECIKCINTVFMCVCVCVFVRSAALVQFREASLQSHFSLLLTTLLLLKCSNKCKKSKEKK